MLGGSVRCSELLRVLSSCCEVLLEMLHLSQLFLPCHHYVFRIYINNNDRYSITNDTSILFFLFINLCRRILGVLILPALITYSVSFHHISSFSTKGKYFIILWKGNRAGVISLILLTCFINVFFIKTCLVPHCFGCSLLFSISICS